MRRLYYLLPTCPLKIQCVSSRQVCSTMPSYKMLRDWGGRNLGLGKEACFSSETEKLYTAGVLNLIFVLCICCLLSSVWEE